MNFKLENLGIVKNAEIEINGLTVVAGENDTGKTTVAKYIYDEIIKNNSKQFTFDESILDGANKLDDIIDNTSLQYSRVVFIDTPNSLDIFAYVKNAALMFYQSRLHFDIDKHRTDLLLLLSQTIPEKYLYKDLYSEIEQIIDGKIYYNKEKDDIFYKKNDVAEIFKMKDTSNGIKMFGYLQILLLNKTIKQDTLLILDEPEVHLHPKWQLKYAEILIKLVQSGVKVLVNSHSPYMVEAIELYAKIDKINSNFYLSNISDNGKFSIFTDVSDNLENIYKKLADPISDLEILSLKEGCFEW
jgi:predicted ATPase